MRLTKLTHANLKTPVFVDLDLVVAWYFSESTKSTHIVATGGAMLPVSESPEQITKDKKNVGTSKKRAA